MFQLQSGPLKRINHKFKELSIVFTNFIIVFHSRVSISTFFEGFCLGDIQQSNVLKPWFSNFNVPSNRKLVNLSRWFWSGRINLLLIWLLSLPWFSFKWLLATWNMELILKCFCLTLFCCSNWGPDTAFL